MYSFDYDFVQNEKGEIKMEDFKKESKILDSYSDDLTELDELEDLESPAVFAGSWFLIVSS